MHDSVKELRASKMNIQTTLEEVVKAFSPKTQPTTEIARRYLVQEVFGEETPYWQHRTRSDRFAESLSAGILYRPEITSQICAIISQQLDPVVTKAATGLMIKGPQGVGKSHSLVNVLRKLESSGEYHVTFFPDCEFWETASDFVTTVCGSFGCFPEDIGFDIFQNPNIFGNDSVQRLLEIVDKSLQMKGKKWVFIFDQINKIFCKPQNREAKDASGLAFPFSLISTVRKVGRIASVISASANNETSYKEYHEGFFAYEHPLRMTNDELLLAFGRSAAFPDAADIINNENIESVIEATSGIPLYAQKYAKNPNAFENEILESVSHSLDRLRKSTHFDNILEAIISSLLLTTVPNWRYDKNFLIQETLGFASWKYTPLFPPVSMAYRSELWKDLMKYVEAKESILLEVCRSPETTNDTRGRLFELMAIRRCQTYGIQDFPVRDLP